MGNCFGSSYEKQILRSGHADELNIDNIKTVKKYKEDGASVMQAAHVLETHRSVGSVHSGSTSAMLSHMEPAARDAFLLKQMKKQVDALERRKAFLENIRNALVQLDGEAESLDSEDENDKYQHDFAERLNRSTMPRNKRHSIIARPLQRNGNFRLKEFNRKSMRRVSISKNKDSSNGLIDSNGNKTNRFSTARPNPTRLLGEGTREWDNSFSGKLAPMRRFYNWDEIPFEFFVDKKIESRKAGQKSRLMLAARLEEKNALHSLIADDRLFGGAAIGKSGVTLPIAKSSNSNEKTPRPPKNQPTVVEIAGEMIEIEHMSSDEEIEVELSEAQIQKIRNRVPQRRQNIVSAGRRRKG